MRDRTRRRNYSPAAEEFRREHERHRAWGLQQRHAAKLSRLRREAAESKPSGRPEPPTRATNIPAQRQSRPASGSAPQPAAQATAPPQPTRQVAASPQPAEQAATTPARQADEATTSPPPEQTISPPQPTGQVVAPKPTDEATTPPSPPAEQVTALTSMTERHPRRAMPVASLATESTAQGLHRPRTPALSLIAIRPTRRPAQPSTSRHRPHQTSRTTPLAWPAAQPPTSRHRQGHTPRAAPPTWLSARLMGVRLNAANFAGEHGFSERTVYRHQARIPAKEQWQPRSRRPHRSPRATPPELQARISKLRAERSPDNGTGLHLRRPYRPTRTGPARPADASRSTINRILARHTLLVGTRRNRPGTSWRRFAYARPRDC